LILFLSLANICFQFSYNKNAYSLPLQGLFISSILNFNAFSLIPSLKIHLLLLIVTVTFILSACDDAPGSTDSNSPVVQSITLSPEVILFDEQVGLNDTTISVLIESRVGGLPADSLPSFAVFLQGERQPFIEGTLQKDTGDNFFAEFDLQTNTTNFQEFDVFVYAFSASGEGNWFQANLSVQGFSGSAPVILEANNPEEIVIPSGSDVIPVLFTAKVTDEDGQNTISQVLIDFINEDGSPLQGNPFELLDDGQNAGQSDSGDAVAGDSVYTIRFFIDSSNTPNNRTVNYYAIDNAGLISDTVTTSFNLIEE